MFPGVLAIKIEQRPNPKGVASRFVPMDKAREFSATFRLFWEFMVRDILTTDQAALCGDVLRVEVLNGDLKGTEITAFDPLGSILDMGVNSLSVWVRPPLQVVETPTALSSVLVRTSSIEPFPQWVDSGHPAYTLLYDLLKQQLEEDGIKGFKNSTHGMNILKRTVKLLYSLSTFFANFHERGAQVPEYLLFADGANDYVQRKQAVRYPIDKHVC